MLTYKDFVKQRATWCPGCGDHGVLKGMQDACAQLNIHPKDLVLVAGIGCSGKINEYFNSYGFHSMHGRTLPVAIGIRMANPNLHVVVAGGDGDGYGIGLNHFIHAVRRNVNITYIVMHNNVYGNTKGQTSPTSEMGYVSGSTPYGSVEEPIHPLSLALANGCTYVAQGIASNIKQLRRLIADGIKHDGFALVNVISPCVTFNKKHTYQWYKERLVDLDTMDDYDPTDLGQATRLLQETDELVIGLIYKKEKPSYENMLQQKTASLKRDLPEKEYLKRVLVEEFL